MKDLEPVIDDIIEYARKRGLKLDHATVRGKKLTFEISEFPEKGGNRPGKEGRTWQDEEPRSDQYDTRWKLKFWPW